LSPNHLQRSYLRLIEENLMKIHGNNCFAIATGASAAIVLGGAIALLLTQPAAATAQFAKDTGKSCATCHTNAKGGGPLTPLGEQFKANGNKMPN
jgi:hypothetical protein